MERNYSLDYLKFFATFFVVIIHTSPFQHVYVWGINGDDINFVLNTLARFAVPFFFMASGYLFAQKILQLKLENQIQYYKKYIYKIIELFATWTAFYHIFELLLVLSTSYFKGLYWKTQVLHYIRSMEMVKLFYYGYYHLWYLSALIVSITLIFLFIRKGFLLHLFFVSLGLNLVGLLGQSYSFLYNLPVQTRDAIFFGLFYTCCGCLFARYQKQIDNWLKYSKVYFGLFLFFSFASIVERYITHNYFEGKLGDYFISTIFTSLALFCFVLSNPSLGKNSRLTKIGRNSVGIYVFHIFFVKLTLHLQFILHMEGLVKNPLWELLFTPMVFVVSYIGYELLQVMKNKILLEKDNFTRKIAVSK